MLARAGRLVLVDLRLASGSHDVRDGVGAEQDRTAVVDLEPVAVERAHGRPGRPVALGVELAAVAGTAVAGRDDRDELGGAVRGALADGRLAEGRPLRAVRLRRAADVRAPVRDDREA